MPIIIKLPSDLLAMAAMEDPELEPVSGPVGGPVGEAPSLPLLPLLANVRVVCLLTYMTTSLWLMPSCCIKPLWPVGCQCGLVALYVSQSSALDPENSLA